MAFEQKNEQSRLQSEKKGFLHLQKHQIQAASIDPSVRSRRPRGACPMTFSSSPDREQGNFDAHSGRHCIDPVGGL